MDKEKFDIEAIMNEVKILRECFFTSERDLQFVVGLAIMKKYKKDATVVMEYNPDNKSNQQPFKVKDNHRQYIDILVIMDNKYYPIELKYKHKKQIIKITENLEYVLSNQSCTTNHRERYCEDIERILNLQNKKIKINNFDFAEGYAIFLTNYEQFKEEKTKNQEKYFLSESKIKENNGVKEINKKFKNATYDMKWYDYDKKEKFSYLITTIKNNKN